MNIIESALKNRQLKEFGFKELSNGKHYIDVKSYKEYANVVSFLSKNNYMFSYHKNTKYNIHEFWVD